MVKGMPLGVRRCRSRRARCGRAQSGDPTRRKRNVFYLEGYEKEKLAAKSAIARSLVRFWRRGCDRRTSDRVKFDAASDGADFESAFFKSLLAMGCAIIVVKVELPLTRPRRRLALIYYLFARTYSHKVGGWGVH